MSLRTRINYDLRAAMRSGDSLRRDVLRMATNSAYNLEKTRGRELSDEELVDVIGREVKTRRESIEAFTRGGRDDLAAKEAAEVEILREYLPQPLSAAELEVLVDQGIAATGAATPRDLGKVMGWLSPRTRGRADGKALSALVAQRLASAGGAGAG